MMLNSLIKICRCFGRTWYRRPIRFYLLPCRWAGCIMFNPKAC